MSYIVTIITAVIVVMVLYIPELAYGENLIPFTLNTFVPEAIVYHLVVFVLASVAIFTRLKSLQRAIREADIRYRTLLRYDAIPLLVSVPLWFFPDCKVFALACLSLSAIMMLADWVIFLKNEYSQVFIFIFILFIVASTNVAFVQWSRVQTTYSQAKLLVDRCESTDDWLLPSAAWSVARYDAGELVHREGKFRFLNHFDDTERAMRKGYYRINHQNTEHFVFARGESVYVVGNASWPDYITYFVNISIIFFLYVAICIFVYWINFIANRRMLISRSFFARLRVSILFFLLGSILIVLLLTAYFVSRNFAQNSKSSFEYVMSLFVDSVTPLLESVDSQDDMEDTFVFVSQFVKLYDASLALYDDTGQLIYTTDSTRVIHNLIIGDHNFLNMKSEVVARVVYDSFRRINIHAYGIVSLSDGTTYYALMWSESDVERIRRELSYYLILLALLYFVLITLAVFFSFMVSRRLASPLTEIYQRLSSFTLGAENRKIDYVVDGNDELALLIKNYNNMVDKLDEAATELALVERENSWRDISRQIAHEIKNPLTPMRLILQQMMLYSTDDAAELKRKIADQASILLIQVDSLYETACSLSDFARQPLQCKVPVNMAEKARHLLDLFRHNDSNVRIEVNVSAEAEDACVYIDKNIALRLFTNLVRNAIQAIPDSRDGLVSINISATDTEVTVVVADNGIGMTKEVLGHIFNANYTTKTKGMGLGLCVVKDAVKASDGQISVESTPGEGSRFIIRWPRFEK